MVLIEVVTALFIFTLVAFSLVMALNAAMDAASRRNEIDTAIRGLESQLALVHASPLTPVDKTLPDDGSGITYHLTVAPELMKDQHGQNVPGLFRVTIEAQWQTGQGGTRSVSELMYQL